CSQKCFVARVLSKRIEASVTREEDDVSMFSVDTRGSQLNASLKSPRYAGPADRTDHAVCIRRSWKYVAGSDPAGESMLLEAREERIGNGRISRCVAEETVAGRINALSLRGRRIRFIPRRSRHEWRASRLILGAVSIRVVRLAP